MLAAELRQKIAENPGVVFEDAAREHSVAPRAVVEALPETMRPSRRATRSSPRWTTSRNGAT